MSSLSGVSIPLATKYTSGIPPIIQYPSRIPHIPYRFTWASSLYSWELQKLATIKKCVFVSFHSLYFNHSHSCVTIELESQLSSQTRLVVALASKWQQAVQYYHSACTLIPKASFSFRILCALALGTVSSNFRKMFAAVMLMLMIMMMVVSNISYSICK